MRTAPKSKAKAPRAPVREQPALIVKPGPAVVAPTAPVAPPDPAARLKLLQLADSLAHLRATQAPSVPAEDAPKPPLLEAARSLVRRLVQGSEKDPLAGVVGRADAAVVDDALDVDWAHDHPALDGVVHVFPQEWLGLRAAAGYLPGRKIAITTGARLTLQNLQTILEVCTSRSTRGVMFHGWSANATLVARALRGALGDAVRLAAVWYGNTAEFVDPNEVRQVALLLELKRAGVLNALTSVKPGFNLLDEAIWHEALLNVGPRVAVPRGERRPALEAALVPASLEWRKNLHTSLFACSAAGLDRVYLTAELPGAFPFELKCEVRELKHPTRRELFTLLPQVDVALNVSVSACQPMPALEALAFRVPCLTGVLELGALDDHPYQALVQLAGVDSISAVLRGLKTLADILRDPDELRDMMVDYEHALLREAFARYERLFP